MKITFNISFRGASQLLAAAMLIPISALSAPVKTPVLPTNSVYQLSVPFTDQDGRASTLADWRGKPVMITMFYSSCQFVCPRIVEALKKTEASLAPQHAKLPVLMVTLDPARDDTATLKAMPRSAISIPNAGRSPARMRATCENSPRC